MKTYTYWVLRRGSTGGYLGPGFRGYLESVTYGRGETA
jgi:hypothetical protein